MKRHLTIGAATFLLICMGGTGATGQVVMGTGQPTTGTGQVSTDTDPTSTGSTRVITIDECQALARENYPALARYEIIERTRDFTMANANRAYLPQGNLNAQASWQSDVTRFDVELPEGLPPIEIPIPDRDQYRIVAELNQLDRKSTRLNSSHGRISYAVF